MVPNTSKWQSSSCSQGDVTTWHSQPDTGNHMGSPRRHPDRVSSKPSPSSVSSNTVTAATAFTFYRCYTGKMLLLKQCPCCTPADLWSHTWAPNSKAFPVSPCNDISQQHDCADLCGDGTGRPLTAKWCGKWCALLTKHEPDGTRWVFHHLLFKVTKTIQGTWAFLLIIFSFLKNVSNL